jgi:hypothetical protein
MQVPSNTASDLEKAGLPSRTSPGWIFLAFLIPALYLFGAAVGAIGSSQVLDINAALIALWVWAAFGLMLTVARLTRRVGLWVLAGAVAGAALCPLLLLATFTIGLDRAFGR